MAPSPRSLPALLVVWWTFVAAWVGVTHAQAPGSPLSIPPPPPPLVLGPPGEPMCTVVLYATGLNATQGLRSLDCDGFVERILARMLPANVMHPDYTCLPDTDESHAALLQLTNSTALDLIANFKDPRYGDFMDNLFRQMGAGCMSYVTARVVYCASALMDGPPAPPPEASLPNDFLPGVNTSTAFQYDYTNTPRLDCPRQCVVSVELTNTSSVGFQHLSTCNQFAGLVTDALNISTAPFLCPWSNNVAVPDRSLLAESVVSPQQVTAVIAAVRTQNSRLLGLADGFNYDCTTPLIVARVRPLYSLSTTNCGPAVQAPVVLQGTTCTDDCQAPLPYPFYYTNSSNGRSYQSWTQRVAAFSNMTLLHASSLDVVIRERFGVDCMGRSRLLSALSVTVLSWGDAGLDVEFDLSTQSEACCGGLAVDPGVGSPAPSPPGEDGGRSALVPCTRARPWDLGPGYTVSPANLFALTDATYAFLNTSRGSVVLLPSQGPPKPLSTIWQSVGIGPGRIMLSSDGNKCHSGATIFYPYSGNASVQSKVVRLNWLATPEAPPAPDPVPVPAPPTTVMPALPPPPESSEPPGTPGYQESEEAARIIGTAVGAGVGSAIVLAAVAMFGVSFMRSRNRAAALKAKQATDGHDGGDTPGSGMMDPGSPASSDMSKQKTVVAGSSSGAGSSSAADMGSSDAPTGGPPDASVAICRQVVGSMVSLMSVEQSAALRQEATGGVVDVHAVSITGRTLDRTDSGRRLSGTEVQMAARDPFAGFAAEAGGSGAAAGCSPLVQRLTAAVAVTGAAAVGRGGSSSMPSSQGSMQPGTPPQGSVQGDGVARGLGGVTSSSNSLNRDYPVGPGWVLPPKDSRSAGRGPLSLQAVGSGSSAATHLPPSGAGVTSSGLGGLSGQHSHATGHSQGTRPVYGYANRSHDSMWVNSEYGRGAGAHGDRSRGVGSPETSVPYAGMAVEPSTAFGFSPVLTRPQEAESGSETSATTTATTTHMSEPAAAGLGGDATMSDAGPYGGGGFGAAGGGGDDPGTALYAAYMHLANCIVDEELSAPAAGSQGLESLAEASSIASIMPVRQDVDGWMQYEEIEFEQSTHGGLLGVGAVGSVYRAKYRGQLVAVKVMTHAIVDGKFMGTDPVNEESLHREFALLSRLAHPNVVHLYGGCLRPPRIFIVEELMAGTLSGLIHGPAAAARLPLSDAVRIMLDVARGLEYLHTLGIVHRDLKPANVLLADDGTAKISDFGLARCKHKTYLSTRAADVGTVAYMAPECFNPDIGGISIKADIYALAVVMWELVSGEYPWDGTSNMAIIYRVAVQGVRNRIPDDPSVCPPTLAALIDACWDSVPAKRPSCANVIAALTAIEAGLPSSNTWLRRPAPRRVPRTVSALVPPTSGAAGLGHTPGLPGAVPGHGLGAPGGPAHTSVTAPGQLLGREGPRPLMSDPLHGLMRTPGPPAARGLSQSDSGAVSQQLPHTSQLSTAPSSLGLGGGLLMLMDRTASQSLAHSLDEQTSLTSAGVPSPYRSSAPGLGRPYATSAHHLHPTPVPAATSSAEVAVLVVPPSPQGSGASSPLRVRLTPSGSVCKPLSFTFRSVSDDAESSPLGAGGTGRGGARDRGAASGRQRGPEELEAGVTSPSWRS